MMRYPKLVVSAGIPIRVVIEKGDINEFGERQTLLDASFLCNYQDAASVKYGKEKQNEGVTGAAYIDGDIAPDAPVISSGYVEIFGQRRIIAGGRKARNLDGTVNYTRLDVI